MGTLIHAEPGVGQVYADAGRRHGSRFDADTLAFRFREAFARQEALDRAAKWVTSEEREFRRWQHIVSEALDDVKERAACFADLYEHFGRPSAWRCSPGTEGLLAGLRRRGLVLAMASNFDGRLRSVKAGLPELRHLDHLLISSEVGSRKPAPAFFETCRTRLGRRAEEILVVGDELVNDYHGARAVGMAAVLLGGARADVDVERIKDLSELPAYLDGR